MDFNNWEDESEFQELVSEKLTEKHNRLASKISASQVVCIHIGTKGKGDSYLVDPRHDEDGLPAMQVFLRANLRDAEINGWAEFTPVVPLPELEEEDVEGSKGLEGAENKEDETGVIETIEEVEGEPFGALDSTESVEEGEEKLKTSARQKTSKK